MKGVKKMLYGLKPMITFLLITPALRLGLKPAALFQGALAPVNRIIWKNKRIVIYFLLFFHVQNSFSQSPPRMMMDFDKNWKFLFGNDSAAIQTSYDDSKWRTLNLPHDWSIEGDFNEINPATTQEAALPTGIGWYRKIFTLPVSVNNKNVSMEFDGIYRNSEVWINGHYLGKRPNGYISFQYDLTPFIKQAPAKNIIAVKVDNSHQPDSRWYSGSGIYRNTRLVISNRIAIAPLGVFITASVLNDKRAIVNIKTKISNTTGSPVWVDMKCDIYDEAGRLVVSAKNISDKMKVGVEGLDVDDVLWIKNPVLWSTEKPYLYKTIIRIFKDGNLIDKYSVTFGIRYFHFDNEKGFFLNGKPLKIHGVCMHHDLGALGAAVNTRAIERQLEILKAMGCNAIRTAHNPPAPEFLNLCDKMGFLVLEEAFDMWKKKKNKFDYATDFDQWHTKDLEDMVKRDRNHPSVFMWSIGNEIREQFDSSGITLTREMTTTIKKLDDTRPVISALTENLPAKNFIWQSGSLDVLGFNYKLNDYNELPSRFPNQKFIAAETASALATRGVYDQPSDSIHLWPPDSKKPFNGNADMTVSAYDNTYAYWGATHEKAWQAVNQYNFIAGCFVWSGFDFLGEPVPYPWPARSSYYGIIDLAGFPKDIYYMYQSEWTSKPVLHVFPHWNWSPGKIIDVWAYYNNADEVELFLNNHSLGSKKKQNDELHVTWRVPFEPGVLKAVSRKNGKTVLIKSIRTAGKPARIELAADRKIIRADGKDLSFITARVVDDRGNLVPDADNLIQFSAWGAGTIIGTDNGYQADTISLKSSQRKCWKGMALAIIQSSGKKGNITVKANGQGLSPAILTLKTSFSNGKDAIVPGKQVF
jgi:beta-galactosidase